MIQTCCVRDRAMYSPGDEEIYLKCADMDDGRVFCAVFNIGLDPIERLQIVCDFEATTFKMLLPNGEEKELDFERDGSTYTLATPCNILDPVILFIEKRR